MQSSLNYINVHCTQPAKPSKVINRHWQSQGLPYKHCCFSLIDYLNKTKVIRADLLDFDFDLDLDFEEIIRFCEILGLVTFHFGNISVLVTF